MKPPINVATKLRVLFMERRKKVKENADTAAMIRPNEVIWAEVKDVFISPLFGDAQVFQNHVDRRIIVTFFERMALKRVSLKHQLDRIKQLDAAFLGLR
jgi:hypothetical protein